MPAAVAPEGFQTHQGLVASPRPGLADGKMLLGGSFTTFNGTTQQLVAALQAGEAVFGGNFKDMDSD